MRRTERVVDVEDLVPVRLHCRAGLIDVSFMSRAFVTCRDKAQP
jgi:hypothetical protein